MIDLSSLNEEQKQAVKTTEGHVRVIASPGSGKTNALTHRYAYLIDEKGCKPTDILCVTYTNKAADEMKGRITKLLDGEGYDFTNISTIHAYCSSFLKSAIAKLSLPISPNFEILDEEALNRVLRKSLKSRGYKTDQKSLNEAKAGVSDYKTNNIDYLKYLLGIEKDFIALQDTTQENAALVQVACDYSRKHNGLFFDDIVCLARLILRDYDEIREQEQKRFKYVMVDEFQDTSYATYGLIKILAEKCGNLFVVGDIDQSIYSFIQAEPKILLKDFVDDYPDTITLTMNNNYRSTEEIIACSNALISNNQERYTGKLTVSATGKKGVKPIRKIYLSEKENASQILNIISHLHDDLLNYQQMFLR